MLNPTISHISDENEKSMGKFSKKLFTGIMEKQKVILSEKEKSDRIEFICILLPLVVTALAIIFIRILYKKFM